jgi:hypothetical protein
MANKTSTNEITSKLLLRLLGTCDLKEILFDDPMNFYKKKSSRGPMICQNISNYVLPVIQAFTVH